MMFTIARYRVMMTRYRKMFSHFHIIFDALWYISRELELNICDNLNPPTPCRKCWKLFNLYK